MLVAEGTSSDDEIATKCGIAPRTIRNWKKDARFQACVAQFVADWYQRLSQYGIASKLHRVAVLDDLWQRGIRLVKARAADERMANVPGGRSALPVGGARAGADRDSDGSGPG